MTERIEKLTALTKRGEAYANPTPTEFDREDLLLPEEEMESKRLSEFILNQNPVITPYSLLTGFFNCDGTVVGDIFRRMGHKNFAKICEQFYFKPLKNLTTFEWQHATANYEKVLSKGLSGIIEEIEQSEKIHDGEEKSFLLAVKRVANALIGWTKKCSYMAKKLSERVENEQYRANLNRLSETIARVPEQKPNTFYEAVLTVYVCFSIDPDSIGTPDRYLYPFYIKDLNSGKITRDEAKEYLQELFLMLQAATNITNKNFTRGGESHFCVGGYTLNGEDGYNDLSELILESLMELPTYIPQVSLRWTKKTPKEVFRHVLDLERRDPHKRIAFQNDERRIDCYTRICKIPYEKAVLYTTVGCNEPAFQGVIVGTTTHFNIAKCIETLLHDKSESVVNCESFDDFYDVFEEQFFSDMNEGMAYDDKFNAKRAQDKSYMSALLFDGCIEKGKSPTAGAGDVGVAPLICNGTTNVIDSLIVVKQFVFDERAFSMQELISALKADYEGYEEMLALIKKRGDFFGNDTERSNGMAMRLFNSMYKHLIGKKNLFGYQWIIGDLMGYNAHNKAFGSAMRATPDGRRKGDSVKFGRGQSEGKDRKGLAALLNSIAKADPTGIGCGSTVTNITIDEQLVKNDANFEKTVDMLEAYFLSGGVHFQLTYVSKEDLLAAKDCPEEYGHLRVRVSGFSDYFVRLSEEIQDDVIARTQHGK